MEAGEAGKALGAAYVLKCAVQRSESGPALNFTMQLFRTADDTLIWTRWFSGDGKDILASASRLSTEMLAELPLPAKPDPKPPSHLAPAAAEDDYRRGKQAQWERTEESLNEALDDFKAATEADPNYAEAFAQLGITYGLLGQYGWMSQADAVAKGDDSVDSALRLNPLLPDGLAARGFSRWFYHWDWDRGEEDYKQAIKLDGSNINALHWYSLALATAGHSAEAEEQMERALALEPKSKILRTNRGWLDYMSGHLDSAAEAMEAVLREDPYFLSARFKLWAVYSLEKRYDDAYRQLNFLLLGTLPADDREHLNRVYHERGYQNALQEWRRHAAQSIEGNTLFTIQIAVFAGDRDGAVKLLTQGLRTHDGWMVFLLNDPALQPVRTDSRLETLIHELTEKRR